MRGEADRIALAEKIITDLDKPKSEVVVDIVVLQAARNKTRDLAVGRGADGLNIPITYNPGGVRRTTSDDDPTPAPHRYHHDAHHHAPGRFRLSGSATFPPTTTP